MNHACDPHNWCEFMSSPFPNTFPVKINFPYWELSVFLPWIVAVFFHVVRNEKHSVSTHCRLWYQIRVEYRIKFTSTFFHCSCIQIAVAQNKKANKIIHIYLIYSETELTKMWEIKTKVNREITTANCISKCKICITATS